jgi:hypothetical protein
MFIHANIISFIAFETFETCCLITLDNFYTHVFIIDDVADEMNERGFRVVELDTGA